VGTEALAGLVGEGITGRAALTGESQLVPNVLECEFAIQIPGAASPAMGRDQIFWALQLMVALFGGLVIAVFLEYIDDRLYTAEMVERSLGLEVVGEVPRGKVT
jgi:capsular polysaccharide biosynthesis protein